MRSFEDISSGYEAAEEIQLKPHKAKVVVQKRSFKELVSPNHLPPSPGDSDSADDEMPDTMEQRPIMRDITRGSPGDQVSSQATKSPERKQLAKKRSQYYEDAFAQREPRSSARERVLRESMIMADVKTNVIVSSLQFHDEDALRGGRFKMSTPLSPIFPTRSQFVINDPNPAF